MLPKFSDNNNNANPYGSVYQVQRYPSYERVALATENSYIKLLIHLAAQIEPPFRVLWILTVPRCGSEPGRYCSTDIDSHEELSIFLYDYQEFFEGDGRHHLWILHPDSGPFVYDHHNVVYAYGNTGNAIHVAQQAGLVEGEIQIPPHHSHSYNEEFDAEEDRLARHFDWTITPLRDGDE